MRFRPGPPILLHRDGTFSERPATKQVFFVIKKGGAINTRYLRQIYLDWLLGKDVLKESECTLTTEKLSWYHELQKNGINIRLNPNSIRKEEYAQAL